jgi:hypothetical protein
LNVLSASATLACKERGIDLTDSPKRYTSVNDGGGRIPCRTAIGPV